MVDVWLPYGKTDVCARIPTRNFLGTIEPKEKPGVADSRAEVERALREPIGTNPLGEIVKSGEAVAVVVDDATRATPSYLMVPPLLDELNRAGVKDESITLIFGCGSHRAVKPEEMKKLVGEEAIERVKVVNHDCKSEDLVYLGTTGKFGTKVYVNKVFAESEVRILTGDVELHYYAGYGGGRKSVLPAISGAETIQRNHTMLLNPKARTGVLEGNPVHEDMVEATKLAKVDFILNIVTNSKNELVKAFAGDSEQAFYEGVKLVDEMYKVPIERRADVVLVSSGGHPLDLNLYQAYKGVDNALDAVKRGGVIVLVAECPEGHGHDVFYDWMTKFKDAKQMEKEIKRRFRLGGHKAYYLLKAVQKAEIILVSAMPDYLAQNVFKLKTARAINDALRDAFDIAGKKARVWAMPHGNMTLPIFKATE
ncbi:MAG: nickel-dependent lactate racemase [Candidatus Bathyarchaeota archaeon]|nr:nickel-dependent lactate racemase [Candidatus Bathyarchaeota archaeon]MDH5532417.1 nickel-dependent lactate racemase [Candidatus Bathyarchaeota archaeon]MDH5713508.1 nickel-dependent lactate racemase [Candidatus Bathyarchaeota archaeon]